jgi:cyclopropane-fatty-acyl-phospholipid synthase
MVRHAAKEYGVKALGVTLSQQQAEWAQEEIKRQGLDDLAEVRFLDYRLVEEGDFDAVSSIGLTEHIGVRNYASYFGFIKDKLKPEARLLNHCITRANGHQDTKPGEFIDRYVFPDGELAAPGLLVSAVHDAGMEVHDVENLRLHYARTLAGWCANLAEHWDECVAEVGENTARVWGLYMAGSRLAFERNEIQLHHILAAKLGDDGANGFPLRPTW